MIRGFLVAGVAACVLLPAIASADTAEEVAAKLGSREFVRSIGLSPEGTQAVVVTPLKTGGETASVINFATGGHHADPELHRRRSDALRLRFHPRGARRLYGFVQPG